MHILVIDDDRDIRDMLAMVLQVEGHEVDTAMDGVAALDSLRVRAHPSLILLDMMMPRLDGEGFLKEMRSDPNTSEIPVVILTGRTDDRRRADELGASGYLTKPVELVELLAAVQGAGREARPEP